MYYMRNKQKVHRREREGTMNTDIYAPASKKLLPLLLLDALKRHSDSAHALRIRDLVELLGNEYETACERKAVSRNLTELLAAGFPVEKTDAGWYYVHAFDNSELRLLIDSVLFSKHIPQAQCKDLVERLGQLANDRFRTRADHIRNLPENLPVNKQLFYTIEILDEAIDTGRQVAFFYNAYRADKTLAPRLDQHGEPRRYIINPYQMVATNGHFYLICNYDKYRNVSYYRLDLITDAELLNTPVKPLKRVKGLEQGLDLPRRMAEHIYMCGGDTALVTFRATAAIVNDIIDWFGLDARISPAGDNTVEVSVRVNLDAMFFWAMQYGLHTEVLAPASLRERLRAAAEEMGRRYKDN